MRQLKTASYIRAIERTRSISVAAAELGISQPALSAHLKKVESQIGAALFDRSKTPLAITDAGRAYLDYEAGVEELGRQLARRISDIEDLRTGSLTVAGATSFNIAYLAPAVARFSRLYPGVELRVVDDTVPAIEAAALAGEVDVFIAPEMAAQDDFEYDELVFERAFLCVPPDWPLVQELPPLGPQGFAKVGAGELAEIARHPLVMLRKDQQVGKMMRSLLERHAIVPGRVITAEQTLTSLALTLSGAGTSLVPETALKALRTGPLPARYLADEDLCSRALFIARPKNRYASRAALKFIEIAKG